MLTKEQIKYYRETYNCGNERIADADEGDACDCWLLRDICDQAILAISLQAELTALKAQQEPCESIKLDWPTSGLIVDGKLYCSNCGRALTEGCE
jgi:hypothetical protein